MDGIGQGPWYMKLLRTSVELNISAVFSPPVLLNTTVCRLRFCFKGGGNHPLREQLAILIHLSSSLLVSL